MTAVSLISNFIWMFPEGRTQTAAEGGYAIWQFALLLLYPGSQAYVPQPIELQLIWKLETYKSREVSADRWSVNSTIMSLCLLIGSESHHSDLC